MRKVVNVVTNGAAVGQMVTYGDKIYLKDMDAPCIISKARHRYLCNKWGLDNMVERRHLYKLA